MNFLQDTSNWRAPAFTQIMKKFDIKSKNGVFYHLKKLQKKGLLDKNYKPIKSKSNEKIKNK